MSLARASRPSPNGNSPEFVKKWVAYGASVRAAQYLILGAKARALTAGRYTPGFDDIRALAHPVLRHRILTNFHAESEGVTTGELVDQLLEVGSRSAVGDVGRGHSIPRKAASGAHLLLPEVLARIDNLDLLARTVVDGFLNGLHRSVYLGLSLDFAEHRPYMPGDDIRRIDWRLFGRTDRHYIKLFEAETNANFGVLLDVSRSMSYGSHSVTKLDYARYLAACLTYFSRHQRDRVGLITFDDDVVDYIPPSARNLDLCLHTLHRAEGEPAGGVGESRS